MHNQNEKMLIKDVEAFFDTHFTLVLLGKIIRDHHVLPEQASSEQLVVAKEETNKRNVIF